MDSWWQFGEHGQSLGKELALHAITCPFCMEKGNFITVFHAEKKKPNSGKKLNFDTLECSNCKGYVMALWSASPLHCSTSSERHSYKVLPWPLKYDSHPQEWPATAGRYWLQAKRSLIGENWDAAAVMARSALQCALREQNASGNSLKAEIDDLARKGLLPPTMREWSHSVRELGNESAHPTLDKEPTAPSDAQDIVEFLEYLLDYLYTLPKKISAYRERNQSR